MTRPLSLRSLAGVLGLGVFYPLGWILAHLPAGVGLWAGRRLGDLAWALLSRRRGLALENLRRVFAATHSEAELRRLGRRSFEHLGMSVVESCVYFFRDPRVMLSRVHVDGLEHLKAAAGKKKGVLILTAHYGNWELLGAAHARGGLPLSVVVRPLDDPALDWLVERLRARSKVELITKRHALREVLEALRRGRAVGILLDQNASRREGVFVPLFGTPASTSRSLAVISLRSGAPVVPVFIRRRDDGTHLIDIHPEVVAPADGDVERYTASFNGSIEAAIREGPEQWFWMHQRWKTQPHRPNRQDP